MQRALRQIASHLDTATYPKQYPFQLLVEQQVSVLGRGGLPSPEREEMKYRSSNPSASPIQRPSTLAFKSSERIRYRLARVRARMTMTEVVRPIRLILRPWRDLPKAFRDAFSVR